MSGRLTVAPVYTSLAIFKPEMPMFLYSLLTYTTEYLSLLGKTLNFLLFAYIMITWWSNILFLGAWFLGYMFFTLITTQNLRSVSQSMDVN